MNRIFLIASLLLGCGPSQTLRVCTGDAHQIFVKRIKERAAEQGAETGFEPQRTLGSWESLDSMDSERPSCDAAIVQADALRLYLRNRVSPSPLLRSSDLLFPEIIHLICNRKLKAQSIIELSMVKHRVYIGPKGSSTFATWRLFERYHLHYSSFPISFNSSDPLKVLAEGEGPLCGLFISAPDSALMRRAEQQFGDQLKLLSINDPRLLKAEGEHPPIFKKVQIPQGRYPRLAPKQLDTLSVEALFILGESWAQLYPEEIKAIREMIGSAKE